MNATKTVSETAVKNQIRETYLKSLGQAGWWAVRVNPDGDIYDVIEASPCYGEDEYYHRTPHTVTIWESRSNGSMSEEEIEAEDENGDWDAWLETNVCDLAVLLKPAGLELID
jgi:hypothetical protein